MVTGLLSPAEARYGLLQGQTVFTIIPVVGLACFVWMVAKRVAPLRVAAPDLRLDGAAERLGRTLQYWLGQWKQPRYLLAGLLHIVLFAGFLALSLRSLSLVAIGISGSFVLPGLGGSAGHAYGVLKDYAALLVLVTVVVAAVRRGLFRPARYAVPARYGKDHTAEALLVLALIATLVLSDGLFEASESAFAAQLGQGTEALAPLSLAWVLAGALNSASRSLLETLHLGSYLVHELTFFAFLCFLPMGKHFHVVTSLFNVYFGKLRRGTIKPVRWGVADEQLDQVKSFGVKRFEDFTWKHMLDFYSCADCGRCSDQCPANAVGRPLSPRFLTIKARNYAFSHYPLLGQKKESEALIGGIYSEDEIWSCTTCGACEEECPLMLEYIDKVVDLRRGMIDSGAVPQSLQKPLKALESRGNPYGKMEKKKADWARAKDFQQDCQVRVLDGKQNGAAAPETLYFVDSVTSYDDRMQSIGRATARILASAGEDFAILGAGEKDSGNEVRRFGEEMLFMALREQNMEAIQASGARRIVTADPHAFNALKNEYPGAPPVEHISQWVARQLASGQIQLKAVEPGAVYAYHDPCYLGRHNQVYDAPRQVLDAIPELRRVEMERCRDRSFCCGGGGLMLFYEPQEEQRMGVLRARMAAEAGANVIVTACPFCMANLEDGVKVAGLEGQMTVIDLAELVDRQMVRAAPLIPDAGNGDVPQISREVVSPGKTAAEVTAVTGKN